MSAAISSASLAVSSAAMAQANAAKLQADKAVCISTMKGFEDVNASAEAKREYAACVRLLVPEPYTQPTQQDKLIVGGLVLFFLVSAIVGVLIIRQGPEYDRGFVGGLFGAVFGAVGGGVVLLAGWGVTVLYGYMTA